MKVRVTTKGQRRKGLGKPCGDLWKLMKTTGEEPLTPRHRTRASNLFRCLKGTAKSHKALGSRASGDHRLVVPLGHIPAAAAEVVLIAAKGAPVMGTAAGVEALATAVVAAALVAATATSAGGVAAAAIGVVAVSAVGAEAEVLRCRSLRRTPEQARRRRAPLQQ